MSNWKSIAKETPTNGSTVTVRILNTYSEPFSATYNSTDQTFTSVASGIIFPAYTVTRWTY